MIHLDTSFLVDLLREGRQRRWGRATAFLSQLEDATGALVEGAPLVTRGIHDFSRITGLVIRTY